MRTMARPPADDFQSTFWETKHALAVASMVAFSRHGVYEGQQYILRCLWEEDGLAPGEVARRLGISTPTVTRAGTRMEAAGLLQRQPHPKDRRLVRLVLTEKGRELEVVIGREMDQLTERALADFSPAERAAVVTFLRKIQSNLAEPRPNT
jgi:MarR family transcriptional regulator, organic hydroperoxide resistance regulator